MEKISTFKDRLHEAIVVSGLQQVVVAERAGISKSLLNKYLKGVSEAGNNKLYSLSQALNVSPVWLMGYDVPMFKTESSIDHEAIGNIIGKLFETDGENTGCRFDGKVLRNEQGK
mgnify:CR=1 FL=1